MQNHFSKAVAGCALAVVCLAHVASAQTPAPGAQPAPGTPVSPVVANPTYISIPLEIAVNRPAAEVWKRVGKFCDVAEWFRIPSCTITSGKDGEFGAVRSVAGDSALKRTARVVTPGSRAHAAGIDAGWSWRRWFGVTGA